MAVALIVAAGRGERLGSDGPKALTALAGRPMLQWSVDAVRAVPAVRRIVVALPDGHLHAAPAGTVAVLGGVTRSESVREGLRAAGAAEHEPVIVHDAARALTEPALFAAALDELERSGADAVIAAVPVSDTIKEVRGGAGPVAGGETDRSGRFLPQRVVTRTLDRSNLWAVQTPQVFRHAILERALAAADELLAAATDDAWLVEQQGGTVAVLPAPHENFKITTPHDLRIAELILSERLAITSATHRSALGAGG